MKEKEYNSFIMNNYNNIEEQLKEVMNDHQDIEMTNTTNMANIDIFITLLFST